MSRTSQEEKQAAQRVADAVKHTTTSSVDLEGLWKDLIRQRTWYRTSTNVGPNSARTRRLKRLEDIHRLTTKLVKLLENESSDSQGNVFAFISPDSDDPLAILKQLIEAIDNSRTQNGWRDPNKFPLLEYLTNVSPLEFLAGRGLRTVFQKYFRNRLGKSPPRGSYFHFVKQALIELKINNEETGKPHPDRTISSAIRKGAPGRSRRQKTPIGKYRNKLPYAGKPSRK